MHDSLTLLICVIVLATVFDFINGFHDTANAIATSVSTRVLSPKVAVAMAAVLNIAGAFAGTAVAKMVGSGLVEASAVTQITVISALLSAIIWDLITWYFGLPTSSSHAILSSLVGAAVATAGTGVIIQKGVYKILIGLIASPVVGLILGYLLMQLLVTIFRRSSPALVSKIFNRSQIVSAAYMAFSHGNNDAQKTMGIITMALVSAHIIPDFSVPIWVIALCAYSNGSGDCYRGLEDYKNSGCEAGQPETYSWICSRGICSYDH